MKNKAFTLIELLAVIVILAVIALIVTPVISNVVGNSKLGALKSSAYGLIESAKMYAIEHRPESPVRFDILDNEIITLEQNKIAYSGDIKKGSIIIEPNYKITLCLSDGVNSVYKNPNETEVTLIVGKVCNIGYGSSIVNLNDSEIKTDMAFDTVDMMKISSLSNGQVVETKGFYNMNDGGGAYYEISNEALTADGASIIALDNGLFAVLKMEDIVSLKQFGAKGDGVTDDTAIVNIALTKARQHTLYVPAGTYMLSDKVYPKSNTTILGEGRTSLFKAVDGMRVSSGLFTTRDQTNLIFKKISVSGNIEENTWDDGHSAQDGIHIFDIWNSSNIEIEDSYFIDNVYAAIRIVGGQHIYIRNSNFLTVDCGVITLGSADNDDLVIENNLFDGHDNSEPISIYGSGKTTNVVIKNNTIRNKPYATAIFVGSGTIENIEVIGNNITSAATGIVLQASHAVLKNNTINNSALTTGGYGIQIGGSTDVVVSGNTITGVWLDGMRIVGGNNNIDIYDNTIKDSGRANQDFIFIRFSGTGNTDIKFHNNNVVRENNNLNTSLIFCYEEQNTQIIDNNIVNGSIYLWPTSSGYVVKNNNNANVTNKGTNNVVER